MNLVCCGRVSLSKGEEVVEELDKALRSLEPSCLALRNESSWRYIFLLRFSHARLISLTGVSEAFNEHYEMRHAVYYHPLRSTMRLWVLKDWARDSNDLQEFQGRKAADW